METVKAACYCARVTAGNFAELRRSIGYHASAEHFLSFHLACHPLAAPSKSTLRELSCLAGITSVTGFSSVRVAFYVPFLR